VIARAGKEVKSFCHRTGQRLYTQRSGSIYQGQYEIQVVPNIVNITYGRDVGYKIEQETFDESVSFDSN
jgi:hypothetical protein